VNRIEIDLPDEQRDRLDARAREEGRSRGELIRQILDKALSGGPDRLAADIAAIESSFGVLDEDRALDRGDGARAENLKSIADR
jgi:plasmid stability protein